MREELTGFEREVSIRGCPWVSLLARCTFFLQLFTFCKTKTSDIMPDFSKTSINCIYMSRLEEGCHSTTVELSGLGAVVGEVNSFVKSF